MSPHRPRLLALALLSCVLPVASVQAAPPRPSLEQLVKLAATSPDFSCYDNPYCVITQQMDWPSSIRDQAGAKFGDGWNAELDVWWSPDGRALLLLDFRYPHRSGCGKFPCGTNDVYAARYSGGVVRDEKFSRIGVPYRGQPWNGVKASLPVAVRADASARVEAFRRTTGERGEFHLDISLPERGTDIRVYVGGGEARVPIYRLKWDAGRGVFVPAKW
ncbi:hypothetical protein ACFP81_00665 [Deinococcus lacus]|uniref:Secreted protein n=1 Tax=Deinococcus lacus TaxID=392561 RepID=A0ABW1YB43_9DEIO